MKCADYTCPYWEKDKECEAADGCAGYTLHAGRHEKTRMLRMVRAAILLDRSLAEVENEKIL